MTAVLVCSAGEQVQRLDSDERNAAIDMLNSVRRTVQDHYYDPQLQGVDLDARCREAKEKLKNRTVDTMNGAFGLAAWLLEPLNDRHTAFIPPGRSFRVENGFRKNFFGQKCYITAVKPGSDAAEQGIKPGDQILGIEGMRVERESAWKIDYSFDVLSPRSALHMIIAAPHALPRELLVRAQVKKLPKTVIVSESYVGDPDDQRMLADQVVELSDKVMLWKMTAFLGDPQLIDRVIERAEKREALILDLRGNPGGLEPLLLRLIGSIIPRDAAVGQNVGRSGERPVVAKTVGPKRSFSGKLIVLVDNGSTSASEIFARVVQLQKRGVVMGDRSGGSVMLARVYPNVATERSFQLPFAVEVTEANLIMADGASLEGVGVTPDELILPTADDLAAGRDSVLARAAQTLGVELTPEKAGSLLPATWYSTK
jgi:carboxyl-terminal processing protease